MIARETWAWAWPAPFVEVDVGRVYQGPETTWFGRRIELDEEPEDLERALQIWGRHHKADKAYVLWETVDEPCIPALPAGSVVHVLAVRELDVLTVPSAVEVIEDIDRAEAVSRVANGVADVEHDAFHQWLWAHYRAVGRGFVTTCEGVDAAAVVAVERDGIVRYQDVCTHPDFRRRGLCTGLVGTVAGMLKGRQVIVAARDTTPDRIYHRLGFERVSWVVEIGVPR